VDDARVGEDNEDDDGNDAECNDADDDKDGDDDRDADGDDGDAAARVPRTLDFCRPGKRSEDQRIGSRESEDPTTARIRMTPSTIVL
jgi:hypothetical protein